MKRLAIGSSVAAVAGYVVGLLTAPKSGKQTRSDIKKAADKGVTNAEKELKKLNSELDKVIKEGKTKAGKAGTKAKQELKEAVDKANKSKQKVREVLSAIHEGDADDEDLKQAVKEAKTALALLKTYLKK